jgi:small nuclear ribonucleoprotein (snRNP)-like protein
MLCNMPAPALDNLVNRRVVLDTQGPMLYIGTLEAFEDRGYWLADADVHDRHDGHSTKEVYINEAHVLERTGSRHVNRRRVFIERHAIVSISALEDVVSEMAGEDHGNWRP